MNWSESRRGSLNIEVPAGCTSKTRVQGTNDVPTNSESAAAAYKVGKQVGGITSDPEPSTPGSVKVSAEDELDQVCLSRAALQTCRTVFLQDQGYKL